MKKLTDNEVARYWDKNANIWTDQVRKGYDAYREYLNNPAFFKFFGNLKDKYVLDAGCGEGYNTRLLTKSGAKTVGVDISPKMIEQARKHEKDKPLGIQYEVASISDLSFLDNDTFDVVVSFMAMMDLSDYENAIKELYRVLRQNGQLYFSITHPCFLTKGFGWLKDDDGNPNKLLVGDYFSNQTWIEKWKFTEISQHEEVEPFIVPCFPKTLSDYINGLLKAGFILKKIEEPRPSSKMCEKHSWLKKWRKHASIFFYIHAEKENMQLNSSDYSAIM